MINLKTLNDLEKDNLIFGTEINILKNEAIKWIKFMNNKNTIKHKNYKTTIKWIKHFFDLNEEENLFK